MIAFAIANVRLRLSGGATVRVEVEGARTAQMHEPCTPRIVECALYITAVA